MFKTTTTRGDQKKRNLDSSSKIWESLASRTYNETTGYLHTNEENQRIARREEGGGGGKKKISSDY